MPLAVPEIVPSPGESDVPCDVAGPGVAVTVGVAVGVAIGVAAADRVE